MPSKVLLASARATVWEHSHSLPARLEALLSAADVARYVSKGDYTAVKLHFGSRGAYRVVRPVFLRKIVEAARAAGGLPFVTDTTRIPGLEYFEVAAANGFTHLTCGAPVVLADGLFGRDSVQVRVENARFVEEIGVASAIYDAPAMIVVSHCKGHIGPGFGGAIKNLAMGGVGVRRRDGTTNRGHLHTIENVPPHWREENCTWCRRCEDVCPKDAITMGSGEYWEIAEALCDRCGRCVRICPADALHMPMTQERFARGMAEATKAVLSTFAPGKVLYVNFVLEVQPECDCMPMADTPIVQDQGIVISDDIVAVDQASLDLINRAAPLPQSKAFDKGIREAGEDLLDRVTGRNTQLSIVAAEEMGLGSRDYELVTVEPVTTGASPWDED